MTAAEKGSFASAAHPFPGLRPFAYDDHAYFFGRQDQIYALYRLADRFRFIAVVGSSGSGKSSLVRAGLLPLLDLETAEPGGHNWIWREMRPGDAPLNRLADLIADLSQDDDKGVAAGRRDRVAAQLRRSSFGIPEALAEARGVAGKSLVLVVDQFEELFRYAGATHGDRVLDAEEVRSRDEATQFVQLLLEASRAPQGRIHVLLTMRSDFIGDCARFHGLPEAVCEAQFLVPSLTRDQLDEVIREPIRKAEASIEPQLVERLLNDCSTEMDQLPVLQHCLSRLWDEAGRVAARVTPSLQGPAAQAPAEDVDALHRHITEAHYRKIGEFDGALSQHADEILKELPGTRLQWAVEQSFRALSELDKEGRATRRALKYSQLVAETGVDEASVRQALNRFRASDCCFLIPPPSEVETIKDNTRIDVGHEALLRRWDKVSGAGADLGWLRQEQQAGERYRALLAMAENNVTALPSNVVTERLAWWKARPRTEEWGERYGGSFAEVEGLLLSSRRRLLLKQAGVIAAFVLVAAVAIFMSVLWQKADKAQAEALRASENALQATQKSIGRLTGFIDDGTIRAEGAQQFLDDAQQTLEEAQRTLEEGAASGDRPPPEIAKTQIALLLAVSDVKDALGKSDAAADLARRAEAISNSFVKTYPADLQFKHLLYASKFRIGDQLDNNGDKASQENAFQAYRAALEIARSFSAADPANKSYQHDLIVGLQKVGDIHLERGEWKQALDLYTEGLRIARSITDVVPVDEATQLDRIAQVLGKRGEPGDKQKAIDTFRQALAIQSRELAKKTDNASRISNIAAIHRKISALMDEKSEAQLDEFILAVQGREKLYRVDPGNKAWTTGLLNDRQRLGDMLELRQDWRGAIGNYADAAELAEELVSKDPSSGSWKLRLAELNAKRGEALTGRATHLSEHPEPPQTETVRMIGSAIDYYSAAAQGYEDLLKGNHPPYQPLFEIRIAIGALMVQQKRFDDALATYQSATALAQTAAETTDVVAWQAALAKAIELGGDSLHQLAGEAMPQATPLTYYQAALAAIDAAAAKAPDDAQLRMLRDELDRKIKALHPNAN
jgi:tetratricopeptide (TPR) repeat protein